MITTSYWCNQAGKWFYRVNWTRRAVMYSEDLGPFDSKDQAVRGLAAYRLCVERICRPWWKKIWDKFVGA